jgi:hypothetical protein
MGHKHAIPGVTYADGGEVTANNLNTLMVQATFTNLERDNCALATNSPVTLLDFAPAGVQTKELWAHTDEPTWPASYVGSVAVPAMPGAVKFTDSGAVAAGDVLEPTGTVSGTTAEMKKATAEFKACAVALKDVSDGSQGFMAFAGVVKVRFTEATVNGGRNFKLGSTAGQAEELARGANATTMLGRTIKSGSGGLAWCLLHR